MCGIVGKIAFNSVIDKDLNLVKMMASAIKHRGPDSEGFFNDRNVAFGHRRLSIIELSDNANQPMSDADNNIILVFNGEIYNHNELREELRLKYKFKTDHSDTETIIYSYLEWGIDCIKKFNGFFALAIYDKRNNETYLVRDRLGKKPLYYIRKDNAVYFSSEAQAFFVGNNNIIKKEINEEAVYHYLTFLTVNAPNTFFRNVNKLECGHYLKISPGKIEKIKYWDIADFINIRIEDNIELAIEKTEFELQRAMQYRNIADVGVSIALSGGLDSSLNLWYSKDYNKNIKSINIAYKISGKYDESALAKRFSNENGIDFIGEIIGESEFDGLINAYLPLQSDFPMGDINSALVFLLSKISSKNASKVMLVGEGGDELGGYPVYEVLNKEYQYLKMLGKTSFLIKYLPSKIANKLDFFYDSILISRRHIHGFTEHEKKELWKGQKYNSYKILYDYMMEIRNDTSDSFLRKILNIEYKLRLPELILARIDNPSMAASIEARSPFMDYKLIEYSAGLPFDIKMKNGAKTILKKIAEKKLPDYLQSHPKVGFGMLLTPFLENIMPIWLDKELLKKENLIFSFLSKEYLENILIQHKKKKNMGYKMWIIFALSKWIDTNKFNV